MLSGWPAWASSQHGSLGVLTWQLRSPREKKKRLPLERPGLAQCHSCRGLSVNTDQPRLKGRGERPHPSMADVQSLWPSLTPHSQYLLEEKLRLCFGSPPPARPAFLQELNNYKWCKISPLNRKWFPQIKGLDLIDKLFGT